MSAYSSSPFDSYRTEEDNELLALADAVGATADRPDTEHPENTAAWASDGLTHSPFLAWADQQFKD